MGTDNENKIRKNNVQRTRPLVVVMIAGILLSPFQRRILELIYLVDSAWGKNGNVQTAVEYDTRGKMRNGTKTETETEHITGQRGRGEERKRGGRVYS